MDPATERVAIYPGTFDPLTNGHVSLARRACEVFDTVILGVAEDNAKKTLFNVDERVAMAKAVFSDNPRIRIMAFNGLTVDFAVACGSKILIRGLRAISDFDYELQIALLNRKLQNAVQTMFLMTDYQWLYVSSTMVKTAARLNGNIRGLVPEPVRKCLMEKYGHPYEAPPEGERGD